MLAESGGSSKSPRTTACSVVVGQRSLHGSSRTDGLQLALDAVAELVGGLVVGHQHPAQRWRELDLRQHGGRPRQRHPLGEAEIDLGDAGDREPAGQRSPDAVVGARDCAR